MAGRGQVLGAKVRIPQPSVLPRERVGLLLDGAWTHSVTLVIAPAGSGKTSALAQFAARAGRPARVAWYRAESSEGAVGDFLAHLERAVSDALGTSAGTWSTVKAAAAALDGLDAAPLSVVIDDFQTLEGTPAEAATGHLARYLPAQVHLVIAGRRPPGFDLSRLRVSGELLEVGPEDLRFRTWEVEQLFRGHYREPLPPEELADLTRRTGGWAAGLQLFHLATRGKPAYERRRVLRSLSTRLRSVREYLARNLLDGLDEQLRGFLMRTSVLGRLSAELCDNLLGTGGSARMLAEAERRHLFLTTDDEGATYRYHEVLRSHLAEMLVDEVGETEARALQQRAGTLLEADGDFAEALFAYWRAEDWPAADRLLAHHSEIVGGATLGLEAIPPGLADRDGWILLATARRQLAAGSWASALDAYRRAEAMFESGRQWEACRRERAALVTWLDTSVPPAGDWVSQLRLALGGEPLAAAGDLAAQPDITGTPPAALASGLAMALAGHLDAAGERLAGAAADPTASTTVSAFARFAGAVAAALAAGAGGGGTTGNEAGDPAGGAGAVGAGAVGAGVEPPGGAGLRAAAEAIDGQAPAWLGRLAVSFSSGPAGGGRRQLEWARRLPDVVALPWVSAALAILAAAVALAEGDTVAASGAAEAAASYLGSLRAGVGLAWAQAFGALAAAVAGTEGANRSAVAALQTARAAGCPGAFALACRVTAMTGLPSGRAPLLATASTLEAQGAVSLAPLIDRLSSAATPPAGGLAADGPAAGNGRGLEPLAVCCFGPFEVLCGGRALDLSAVKPRARMVLQLLAVGGGHPVHRDELLAALWPDDDMRSGTRNLQVAISSLRQLLDPAAAREAASLIPRQGDAYLLALRPGDTLDVARFAAAGARAAAARRTGDRAGELGALWEALDAYRGELLAGSGSADWVVERRERFRMNAAEAAQELASTLLEGGDAAGAVVAAERGLAVDRYRDGLWRALIAAFVANSDRAAAAKATKDYDAVLAELGIAR